MSSSPSAFTRRTSSLAGGLGAEGELDIRSEEHTSEPQSHHDLVCRLLLEKKKTAPNPARGPRRTRRAATPPPPRQSGERDPSAGPPTTPPPPPPPSRPPHARGYPTHQPQR